MHILQIKQPTETWIVAISQHKEDITDYLATLSVEIQADAVSYEIPFEYYPFILIQNIQTPHNSESYFEFCDFETLQIRIKATREQKVESDDHIYFKYYYISEPYGQMVTDENWMHHLRHTSVTNYNLDQPYPVSFFHEEVKKNASNYDIDRLDQLFEHTKTRFTSAIEKEDLAINGYESLFWDMNYDHACGKLTDSGITYLIPMIEKMEILLGEKKWQHRSFALQILYDQACKEKSDNALELLSETVITFENYLHEKPEETLDIHRLLTISYRKAIAIDPKNALLYWQQAYAEINKAVAFSPEKASWSTLLELLYEPFSEHQDIQQAQQAALISTNLELENLEKTLGAAITYPIALAYHHLEEYLGWNNPETIFPETEAIRWAEKALAYIPVDITRMDLHECTHFFNQIGSQYNRTDFLKKAIELYQPVLDPNNDCILEVYYTAKLWKEIAEIHLKNKENLLADQAINEAISLYNTYMEKIESNPSMYLHYAEFLEYCYSYQGAIEKPSLAHLKQVAREVEIQSEGFLSYPYVLLMRIALYENNEEQAIVELTKSMILHESCADSTIEELIEELQNSSFMKLKSFLEETKKFVESVNENYYYDPELKWKTLRTMSADELIAYWENRKEEIRTRPSTF